MIEQTLTPKDTIVNLTFEIPKNLVGKPLKVFIDFEKDDDEQQMTQEDFLKWIDDAEKSPTMSLETFNEKWEKKKSEILARMR
ncbi:MULTISPECIES: hypothetical protein [Flavobacterium]|uniref:Uncharacterized protein n=1 Tax=Flavobacterium gawalongense TaxID=2594432 RepID=A0A553BTS8_9FLAO|nr:hypothetical protein [Flavobacterium gawalongense]TRX11635.1 hypothetical protein FNW11_05460 [Flavobacterium gawalongense]TRX12362.1 hypothetical protein FNW10_04430 [Flavobacterium gawalongense]TRX30372.1 hypothetical protein FNW38_04725 [Flavobacterium gawalongense]